MSKKIIVFDTETTGLPVKRGQIALLAPKNWPDIVSISWSVFLGVERIKHVEYIVKPTMWMIPAESAAIHGISHETALIKGIPLVDVLMEFKQDIADANHIIAHNLEFDKNVVFNAFKWRLGLDPTPFWPRRGDVCSMRNSELEIKLPIAPGGRKTPTGYKAPKLDELWKATFDTEAPPGAHGASRDVEVLEKICLARWKKTLFLA